MVGNERVVRAFYDEFVNTGDESAADDYLDPAVEFYFGGRLVGTGVGAFRPMLAVLRAAFPDLHTTIEQVVACDDMVCERVATRGTHLGTLALAGIPPLPATGRPIEMHGISMFQLRDGKIVANWAMPDQLGLLAQLGVLDKCTAEFTEAAI